MDDLKTSTAKLEGNKRHIAKLDRIMVQPSKEDGARIREAAAKAGVSLQKYILEAVYQRMESEK